MASFNVQYWVITNHCPVAEVLQLTLSLAPGPTEITVPSNTVP